jgi:hypothetical protein
MLLGFGRVKPPTSNLTWPDDATDSAGKPQAASDSRPGVGGSGGGGGGTAIATTPRSWVQGLYSESCFGRHRTSSNVQMDEATFF